LPGVGWGGTLVGVMKRLVLALLMLVFLAGCATRQTKTGHHTSLLGGLAEVNTGSYQAAGPATIGVDASQLTGRDNPTGTRVRLLWGLLTFTDN
jgi:uncharacterized protein YceK